MQVKMVSQVIRKSETLWRNGSRGCPNGCEFRWQKCLAKRRNDRKFGFAKRSLEDGMMCIFIFIHSFFVKEGKWWTEVVFLEFLCHNNRTCSTTTVVVTCNPSRFQENTYTYLKGLPGPVLQVRATWKGKKTSHLYINSYKVGPYDRYEWSYKGIVLINGLINGYISGVVTIWIYKW